MGAGLWFSVNTYLEDPVQSMLRSLVSAAVISLAVLTSAAAQMTGAMPSHDGMSGMPHMEGMPGMMMGGMDDMMSIHMYDPATLLGRKSDLKLTADQAKKLDALAAEMNTARDHAKAEHDVRHARIVEQFKLASPDPARVKADGQEAMQEMAAAHGVALSVMARAKGLLTDAQRATVDSWVAEHATMPHGDMPRGEMHH